MLIQESAVPPTPPLRLKSVDGWTPAYSSPQTVFKPSPPTGNSFATPLLDSLFTPQETGQSQPARPAPDSSRSGVAVPKGGERKLDITVIDHPNYAGVLVSRLGDAGACRHGGLRVGDHIMSINGIRARDHRTAMWLADAAENRVRFGLADKSEAFTVDRALGDVGLTLVNNNQAGLGCVVVSVMRGLAGARAGLEVGHVIMAVDGELAWEHSDVIRMVDEASGPVQLTVAARKLTEKNVLEQHLGCVPCEVIIVA